MIRSVRIRVPLFMSIGLMLASCGIALDGAAQATQIAPEDMTGELVKWALGSGATIIAAFWALLRYHLSKTEQLQSKLIAEAIVVAMIAHNRDEFAHPAASEHNHKPMQEQLDDIDKKLDRLIAEHEIISGRTCPGA